MSSDTTSTSPPPRSFSVHHQSVFITGEDDEDGNQANTKMTVVDDHGLLALGDEPFETTLFHHGIEIDTQRRTSRIDTGGSEEFIDDRPLTAIRPRNSGDSTEDRPGHQGTLFTDTVVDQRTLDGERANARFIFETDRD